MKRTILGLVIALLLSQSAAAQTLLKNVRTAWEGNSLIFYATFNGYGHDLPVYLEWQTAKTRGRTQIDYIEQYGRDMPIAVTLMTRDKSLLYMGRVAPNTPSIESDLAVQGRVVVDKDAYPFSVAPSPIR